MKSTIEKLYYGEISPCSLPVPDTEKYKKALIEVEQAREKLLEEYPKCKDLLELYTDSIHITASCECLQDFTRGFKLGAEFMLEMLTD